MGKRIVLINLFVIISYLTVHSQNVIRENFEIEFIDGIAFPIDKDKQSICKPTWSVAGEFNYRLKKLPMNCGLFIEYDCAKRDYQTSDIIDKSETASFGLVSTYYLCGSNIRPYVGLRAGAAYHKHKSTIETQTSSWSGVATPKIGIEIFNTISLGVYTQFSQKKYNTIGLSIGITFGGKSMI